MSRHLNPEPPARDRAVVNWLAAACGAVAIAGLGGIANAAGDDISVTAPQAARPAPTAAPVTHTYGKPILPVVGDPAAPAYPLGDGDQAAAVILTEDVVRQTEPAPAPCRCEEREELPAPSATVPAPPVVEQPAQPAAPAVTPDEEEPTEPDVELEDEPDPANPPLLEVIVDGITGTEPTVEPAP